MFEKVENEPPALEESRVEQIATHEGYFHTDEVFATAILKDLFPESMELASGGKRSFIEYIRTRDKSFLDKHKKNSNSLLVDVGTDHDPAHFNFDHHQPGGAGARENGIEYATAGLIWKQFGKEWITYMDTYSRHLHLTPEELHLMWKEIDETYVQMIDANDTGQMEEITYSMTNGLEMKGNQFTLPEMVRLYNTDTHTGTSHQDRFNQATEMIRTMTLSIAHKYFDLVEGLRKFDKEKCTLSADGRTLVINGAMPLSVTKHLLDNKTEFQNVEFCATRSPKGTYNINVVPIGDGQRVYRNPGMIPNELRVGNNAKKANEILGTKGVTFVHVAGFMAQCRDLETTKKFLDYLTR